MTTNPKYDHLIELSANLRRALNVRGAHVPGTQSHTAACQARTACEREAVRLGLPNHAGTGTPAHLNYCISMKEKGTP